MIDDELYEEGQKKIISSLSNINIEKFNISSGFFDALFSRNPYILLSNVTPIYHKSLKDFIDDIIVLRSHISYGYKPKTRIKKYIMRLISSYIPIFIKREVLKRRKIVILPNKYTYNKLKIPNSVVIYHGIDLDNFVVHRKKFNKERLNIRYFGHPAASKGFIEVVKTFSNLESTKFNKELYLTFLNRSIINFVKKNDNTIKIFGRLEKENLIKKYLETDIVLLPYRHQIGTIAVPLVLIESMASGIPIITSNLEHIKEIAGDCAEYVKPYDVKDMIEKANYLYNNRKRLTEMSECSIRRVRKFDIKNTLKKYKEICDILPRLKAWDSSLTSFMPS